MDSPPPPPPPPQLLSRPPPAPTLATLPPELHLEILFQLLLLSLPRSLDAPLPPLLGHLAQHLPVCEYAAVFPVLRTAGYRRSLLRRLARCKLAALDAHLRRRKREVVRAKFRRCVWKAVSILLWTREERGLGIAVIRSVWRDVMTAHERYWVAEENVRNCRAALGALL